MKPPSLLTHLRWWQILRLGVGIALAALSLPFADLVSEQRWSRWKRFVHRLADIEEVKRIRAATQAKLKQPAPHSS